MLWYTSSLNENQACEAGYIPGQKICQQIAKSCYIYWHIVLLGRKRLLQHSTAHGLVKFTNSYSLRAIELIIINNISK